MQTDTVKTRTRWLQGYCCHITIHSVATRRTTNLPHMFLQSVTLRMLHKTDSIHASSYCNKLQHNSFGQRCPICPVLSYPNFLHLQGKTLSHQIPRQKYPKTTFWTHIHSFSYKPGTRSATNYISSLLQNPNID